MKKLIVLLLLSIFNITANAAPLIKNMTNCPIKVAAACYNVITCMAVSTCSTVTVPANSTAPLPVCSCGAGLAQGYAVCCGTTATCVAINDGGTVICPNIPSSTTLPACSSDCPARTISWSGGNLVIQ